MNSTTNQCIILKLNELHFYYITLLTCKIHSVKIKKTLYIYSNEYIMNTNILNMVIIVHLNLLTFKSINLV
ncbi:unnamed protein product [Schistosoma mattheei]|uniref:Uncharacterized protein n=1 Tax=Schistosoma mattheei TaxID=31246 RepID=A0AA85BXI4_9TREM|nr:unnamed protein product [Schistosoma mattheei]